MTDTITIRRPDDWHVHLRDGEMLKLVAPFTARQFARAIVMPNLAPPVTTVDQHIGRVSLVGAGMRTNPGVSATFFRALADAGVNIDMISTSEIRISVVTRDEQLDEAVQAVHTAFGLDSSEGEAVVYGGTGR